MVVVCGSVNSWVLDKLMDLDMAAREGIVFTTFEKLMIELGKSGVEEKE